MRYINTVLLVLVIGVCFGQISVSTESIPRVGDTLRTRVDLDPSISIGTSGPNQEWAFLNLAGTTVNEVSFLPNSAGSSTQFISADAVSIGQNGTETYYSFDNNQLLELGQYTSDPFTGILNINATYTSPLVLRRAPLRYEDQNTQGTSFVFPVSSDVFPDSLLNQLPLQADSFRLRIMIDREDEVDAFGNLNLNGEWYEVLREKRVEMRTTFVDAFLPILGWQDITAVILQLLPNLPFGNQEILTSYLFYGPTQKEPIALVNVDSSGVPRRVEYIDRIPTNTSTYFTERKTHITASPNPTIGFVEFAIHNAPFGKYEIKVRNIIGQIHWTKELYVNGNTKLKVDLTQLKRGTYFYTLEDENGNIIQTKRLVFIRA